MTATIDEVLTFWFVETPREAWFRIDPDFDRLVGERFSTAYDDAANGGFSHWRDSARGCVALLILLDQAPRNIYRGSPQAFATDTLACEIARHAIDRGFDRDPEIDDDKRLFLYTPLMHSENLDHQDLCVRLINERMAKENRGGYAERHRDIIARFGRFPHRNDVLARDSTPEERDFLMQDGSSF